VAEAKSRAADSRLAAWPRGLATSCSDLRSLISDLCTRLRRVLGAGYGRGIRAIRTARLHGLPRFDLRPIDVVVDHGSRRDLVLRRVSRLDAVSGYPDRT
jgi:hypothetical protein